jgi:hypothetical protein
MMTINSPMRSVRDAVPGAAAGAASVELEAYVVSEVVDSLRRVQMKLDSSQNRMEAVAREVARRR